MRRVDVDDLPARPEVRSALERFLREVEERHGDRVGRVVVYGSVARGQAGEGSDVDLLVIWSGKLMEALDLLVPLEVAVLRETGVDISIHPMTAERYRRIQEMRTGFYENVEREGLVVAG